MSFRPLPPSAESTAFSILSAITFVLVIPALPWHFHRWNVGAILYRIWTGIGLLIFFVNSIAWRHDAINRAPVWCDISTKILAGFHAAIPATSLCIVRRLYKITRGTSGSAASLQKKHYTIMVDLSIGVGIPILLMLLHFVVQSHRFDIFEEMGCIPTAANTALTYVLLQTPVLVMGIAAATYGVMTIFILLRRQRSSKMDTDSTTGVSRNVYSTADFVRLMGLAVVSIVFTTPITVVMIILNATTFPVEPYVSWNHVHRDFSSVGQIPGMIWRTATGFEASVGRAGLYIPRWATVVGGLIFFFLYGLAPSSVAYYKTIFRYLTWPLHRGQRRFEEQVNKRKDRKGVVDTTCMFHEQDQCESGHFDCGCHSLTAQGGSKMTNASTLSVETYT